MLAGVPIRARNVCTFDVQRIEEKLMPSDVEKARWAPEGQDIVVSFLALIERIATHGLVVEDNYGRKFQVRLADRRSDEPDGPPTDEQSNVRAW